MFQCSVFFYLAFLAVVPSFCVSLFVSQLNFQFVGDYTILLSISLSFAARLLSGRRQGHKQRRRESICLPFGWRVVPPGSSLFFAIQGCTGRVSKAKLVRWIPNEVNKKTGEIKKQREKEGEKARLKAKERFGLNWFGLFFTLSLQCENPL